MAPVSSALHVASSVLVIAMLIRVCLWIGSRSRILGLIVWSGVALRLAAGLGLFMISYTDSAFLRGVHTGDGFWSLAPDARVYYDHAARVGASGWSAVSGGDPSPLFSRALGYWFVALGTHVPSAIMFNLACYVATCAVLVYTCRQELRGKGWPLQSGATAAAVVVMFTYSPMLVLTSTQVLKDTFFALLIVLACLGTVANLTSLRTEPEVRYSAFGASLLVIFTTVYGIAGIRAYYALLMCAAYTAAFVLVCLFAAKGRRVSVAGLGIGSLVVIYLAFRLGAGPYYDWYMLVAANTLGYAPAPAVSSTSNGTPAAASVEPGGGSIVTFRDGFVRSGGNTNLAATDSGTDATDSGMDLRNVVVDVGRGLLATFVPISLLEALSIVSLNGGGGFLAVTDADTLFLDLGLIAVGAIIWRDRRRLRGGLPAMAFLALLAIVSALLLGYVVTNYGTLFRLRLLAVVPAWLTPLAILREVSLPLAVAGPRAGPRTPCAPPIARS